MPKIAILDHRNADQVAALIAMFESAGHQTRHINNEDPALAYAALVEYFPDVIYADLFFENKDGADFNNWWGVRIIKLLREGPSAFSLPVFVESKYVDEHVLRLLEGLNIPRDRVKGRSALKPKIIFDFLGRDAGSNRPSA